MRSRIWTVVVVLLGLGLSGLSLHGVVKPLSQVRHGWYAAPASVSIETTAVHGFSFGVLGGFRAIAADLAWLKTYLAWEQRDTRATEAMLELTTALDDRPLCFWLNGARMLAYDIPAWRIDEANRVRTISELQRARLSETQAQTAIQFLQRAIVRHPTSAALWSERANIELNCLRDLDAAADSFRRASEQPDASYYPARIHAELLRRLGRKAEALAWLVKLYPTLPTRVEAAAADLVLARIRELEDELSISPADRFSSAAYDPVVHDPTLTPSAAAR